MLIVQILLFVVLFLLIKAATGSPKVVCSPSTVQAHLGRDVVLSCRVEPPSDLTNETLEWKCGTENVHVYRSRKDDPDNQDLRFKGRTILNHQNLKDGNVSLTLTNVTMKDEGNYTLCLRTQTPFICSDVTLTVVLQTDNTTHDLPGSALSSGGITAIVVVSAVVGGILAFIYYRRNRFCFHRGGGGGTLRFEPNCEERVLTTTPQSSPALTEQKTSC